MYDYLIVGAGLFGAVFARQAMDKGKTCLVVERRAHVGGNLYTERRHGIDIHRYGAHIFHTSDEKVWAYVQRFASFNHYINSPVANYKGTYYSLPFNMNTFHEMWGVTQPEEARAILAKQTAGYPEEPKNLEEQALKLVGRDLYETLVRGYTEKQWGRPCRELPAFIIRRLPVRFTYDNNYFNDPHQGIPEEGYTALIERLLEGATVRLNCDYLTKRGELDALAEKVVYTGPIDAFFDYEFGELEYRSLRFETDYLEIGSFQGRAVVNYTDVSPAYTRILEHKFFNLREGQEGTYITREYPDLWHLGKEPYYTVNNEKNQRLYEQYAARAARQDRVCFGGRLAEYRYYDMDKTIASALALAEKELCV